MKNFKLSRPQSQIIALNAKNSKKSAILKFFQPLWNLHENWSFVCNMQDKFGKHTWKSYRAHK